MITWAEILEEAGSLTHRERQVRTFRKYEGQVVEGEQVTLASYARRAGIIRQTFNDWVKANQDQDMPDTGTARTPNPRLAEARKLAEERPELSYRKIGPMVGIDESVIRRDPEIRAIRNDSYTKDFKTVACRTESPGEMIANIDADLKRLFNPNYYHVGEMDLKRLRRILTGALDQITEREQENSHGTASKNQSRRSAR